MGGPHRINPVSIGVVLLLAAGVYFAWKLVPVYLQASKVDNILSGYKQESAEIDVYTPAKKEESILDRLREDLIEAGIEDPNLLVWFGEGYTSLHAAYTVEVRFLFGQSKTFRFDRSIDIPQDDS